MVFIITTQEEKNHHPDESDFLPRKKQDHGSALNARKQFLDHNLVSLRGNEGSYYWVDSRGLNIYICRADESLGRISIADIRSIVSSVLESTSYSEIEQVLRFAEKLLFKIYDVLNTESNQDNSIDVLIEWKSIALLILSFEYPGRVDIGVRIGSGEYKVPC